MKNEIDYIELIPREQRVASIGEIVVHEMSGGTFKVRVKSASQVLREFFGHPLIYSHKCSCNVVQKCTKSLPIILCNN